VEIVLIDEFVVPEESKFAFLTEVRKSAAFRKARMAEAAITL
jgi:hypothetical protein